MVGMGIALITMAFGQGPRLGLLVFLAMTFNVFIAGSAGAFIPGFAFLLGLAGWFLG